jgi:hypothetical protein
LTTTFSKVNKVLNTYVPLLLLLLSWTAEFPRKG